MLRIILVLAASVAAQQVYENVEYNARYEAPAGWAFPAPEVGTGTIRIKPNRPGLNPIILELRVNKHATMYEAFQHPASRGFFESSVFFSALGNHTTKSPTIFSMKDTVEGDIHFCFVTLKQIDLDMVMSFYSASNRTWSQSYLLATSLADFNVNEKLYYDNWLKLNFISRTGPTAKHSSNLKLPAVTKAELIDLLGRQMREVSASQTVISPKR